MTHVLARLDKGKRRRPKVSTYTLPAEKLAQREAAFIIYRDMGTGRSIVAVERKLKQDHPEIAVSRPTLEKWSRQHDWAERVRQHDAAARAALQRAGQHGELSADFDQVDKLTRAAHLALERALNGQPVVTKASDVNTLVSAAAKALSLADEIRVKRGDNTSREQIIAEMDRILDLAESRRRQDAVDALRALGITEEQMLALGLRAEDGVRVDMSIQAPDEQQVVVSADEGIAVEPDEMAEEASTDRRVRDVAVLAPQPPPAPTRFSELFDSEG